MPRNKKDGQSNGLEPTFRGFSLPTSNSFEMPKEFVFLLARIHNASELKIVTYIIIHTWSERKYGIKRWMTVDEFMNGIKVYDPVAEEWIRVDEGTQLSERSVINGINAALIDGYIECEVDDTDLGRVKRFFCLKMDDEAAPYQDSHGMQILQPWEKNEKNPHLRPQVQTLHPSERQKRQTDEAKTKKNRPRMQTLHPTSESLHPRTKLSASRSLYSSSDSGPTVLPIPLEGDSSSPEFDGSTDISNTIFSGKKPPIPAFMRLYIEDFSRKFNDVEQIYSNLRQAANIYYESGLDQDSFINCLYEAQEITLKAHVEKRKNGHVHRMPYFFSCLRESVNELLAYRSQGKQG